jgi:hypothetical protein
MVSADTEIQEERKYTLTQLRGAYGAGWHAGKQSTTESASGEVDAEWQEAMEVIAKCVERRQSEGGESLAFIARAAEEAINFGTRYYASEVIMPLSAIVRLLRWGHVDELMTLREFLEELGLDHPEGINVGDEPVCGEAATKLLLISALLWKDDKKKKAEAERNHRQSVKIGGEA